MAAEDPNRPQDIVGRQGLIDELAGAEPALGAPCVYVVRAPAGMGRTSLLAALRERLRGERETLRAPLGGFRDDVAADDASNTRERRKGRNVINYRRLLEALASDLEGADDFAAHARELVRGAESEFQLELAKDELQEAFLTELKRGAGAPLALLFDDYTAVADEELARWIIELIDRIGSRRPVLAVTTTVGLADVPEWLPPHIQIRELEPFTRAEIADLLERALPGVTLSSEWPKAIDRWCGGYPAAVSVAIDLAGRWPRRPDLLDGDKPPPELEGKSRALYDQVTASVESEAERAALEVAAVARRFDGVLLRTLLADAGLTAPPDLETRLARYPFVVTEGDPNEPEYRVLPFVRHVAALELQSQPPRGSFGGSSRLTEIRQRALYFYSEQVTEEAQRRGRGYELEDPKNQETLLEFLHYASLFEDRSVARYMLAEAYLTAFWWWGWYLESSFCVRELDEWERTQPHGDDAQFLAALRLFHDSYPPYFERFLVQARGDWPAVEPALDGDWRAVEKALRRILELIDFDTARHDSKHEVGAIIDVFLAHSLRGRRDARSHDAQIDSLHASARAGFAASRDYQWSVSWVLYDEADTRLERRAWKEADERAHAGLAAAEADEEFDPEVFANLHRILGDAGFERGSQTRGFDHYGRALVYAWEFQAVPELGDDYTRGLYEELTSRVHARLEQLRAQDPKAATAAADLLTALWEPYFSELDTEPMRLHPPAPGSPDLVEGSTYVQRVLALAPEIKRRANELRAASARPSIRRVLRSSRDREREPAGAPPSHPPGGGPLFAAPVEPAETADLFENAEHPLWPGSWREFPAAWPELDEGDPVEVSRRVRMAIDELPEGWRLVLQRRDVDGWSSEAVARRFAIPASEQTVILHHARASIRRSLATYFAQAGA